MKPMNVVVREALARRARRSHLPIHSSQHLRRDLELSQLDLVLLAIDVEKTQDVEVPVDELLLLETVADLLLFFSRVGAEERRSRHARVASRLASRS